MERLVFCLGINMNARDVGSETVGDSGMVGTGHIVRVMILMIFAANGNTTRAQIMIGVTVVTTPRALNEMFHLVGFCACG